MKNKWILKALVQKSISLLPCRNRLNYFFQNKITHAIQLSELHWHNKITHAKDHISFFNKYASEGLSGKTVLELGTGWYPIIPVSLFLCNVTKVISLDIQSWMNKTFQLNAIDRMLKARENGELDSLLPYLNEERWKVLMSISENREFLSRQEISNLICLETRLADARNTGIPDESIDFICSNNTLEHIRKEVLTGIIEEFKRIIKPDGVMSHFIDMSDHFSHFDPSITNYNFLRYSKSTWNLLDNRIQPQNRLRFSDYKNIYLKTGIPVTEEIIIGSKAEDLQKTKVHSEFSQYSQDDLAVTHAYLISKFL